MTHSHAVMAKPAAAPAGIAEVQQVNASGTGTSPTLNLSSATAGNILIAVLSFTGNTLAECTNPADFNTAAELVQATNARASRQAWKLAAGGETAITFTTTNSGNWRLTVFEFSGMAASPVDQSDTSATVGTATSLALGATGTTSQADELAIIGYRLSGASGGSEAADNSFTIEVLSTTHGLATKTLTATGTVSCTLSWTNSVNAVASLVTYKKA